MLYGCSLLSEYLISCAAKENAGSNDYLHSEFFGEICLRKMIIGNQSFMFVCGIALNFGNASRKIDGLIKLN